MLKMKRKESDLISFLTMVMGKMQVISKQLLNTVEHKK